MSNAQVSQTIAEVGARASPSGYTSQALIEVGFTVTPSAEVSQALIEVMYEVSGRVYGPAVAHI